MTTPHDENLSKAYPIIDWVMCNYDRQYFQPDITEKIEQLFGDTGSIFRAKTGYTPRADGPEPAKKLYYAWRLSAGKSMVALDPLDRVQALYDLLIVADTPILVTPNKRGGNKVVKGTDQKPIDWDTYAECLQLCAIFFPEAFQRDNDSGVLEKATRFHFDTERDYLKEKYPQSYPLKNQEEMDVLYERHVGLMFLRIKDYQTETRVWEFTPPRV